MRTTALVTCVLATAVATATAKTELLRLFDFEAAGDAAAWAALAETEWKEPAPKVEGSRQNATAGQRSLRIVFPGGHLPAVTCAKVPAADVKQWLGYESLAADVVLDKPCVVGLRVLQQKGQRVASWSPLIPRWQTAVVFPAGRHTIEESLKPMLREEWGKIVAVDIFACNPPKDLTLFVDNIRLSDRAPARPAGPHVRTDVAVYPEPAPPGLPKAGETFTDPTFGTKLLRLTDEEDGDSTVAYSYWPSFNKDSTSLFVNTRKNGPILFHFDPKEFKVTSKEPLFARDPEFPGAMGWEDACWSGTDPKVIYGHGNQLLSYNLETRKFTLVKDFSKELPNLYPQQMSRSLDDNVFAFSTREQKTYKGIGFAVWRRDTDKIVLQEQGPDLDEVQVDKSGRYVVVKSSKQGKGIKNVFVHDLQTGKKDELIDDEPDYSPGHSDNGQGICVGADNFRNATTFRSLADPHRHYMVLDKSAGHMSMQADDPAWVLMSDFFWGPKKADAGFPTFGDEIYLVSTDGSQRVRRLAHHHSDVGTNYWHCPRANISRDGRFVAFTSNWGNAKHSDVFVLHVPEEEKASASRPATIPARR